MREQAGLVAPHDTLKKPCISLCKRGPASVKDSSQVNSVVSTYVEEECFHEWLKLKEQLTCNCNCNLHHLTATATAVSDSDALICSKRVKSGGSSHCPNPFYKSQRDILLVHSTMSVCPPYAPFFGFAGVASAVSMSLTPLSTRLNCCSIRLCCGFIDDIQQCV